MAENRTRNESYTKSLIRKESKWWKQLFDRQAPYRWNIRRLKLGFILDLGCGLGRNLGHLKGNGVGVDHNPHSVAVCRSRGFTAFEPTEFRATDFAREGAFDSLLIAHVIEHNEMHDAENLLREYLPYVKQNGTVVMICPQERSFKTDHTHINFSDFEKLGKLGNALGLKEERHYSFPFPRSVGRIFSHNEFVVVFKKV